MRGRWTSARAATRRASSAGSRPGLDLLAERELAVVLVGLPAAAPSARPIPASAASSVSS